MGGCGQAPVTPQSGTRPAADDLGRVLAIARTCMAQRDGDVVLGAYEVVTAAPDAGWRVQIRDQHQALHEEVVDPKTESCAGLTVTIDATPRLGSVAALTARGWGCAQELGAQGVGGSPLVREGLRLHSHNGAELWFSIPEASATTMPSGMDLTAGPPCSRRVMD